MEEALMLSLQVKLDGVSKYSPLSASQTEESHIFLVFCSNWMKFELIFFVMFICVLSEVVFGA